MASGDKPHNHHHLINFHLHLHHQGHHHGNHHGKKESLRDIPKGCLAIMVGGEGEEPQRVIVPVIYVNHPLFMQLLKEAEEVYGFDHDGPINIPCHVEEFRHVQGMIDEEKSQATHHHHHHHHINHGCCFKA